jgi:hypothetical protein
MKRTAQFTAFLFVFIIVMISLRYSLFISYVNSQKAEFRNSILKEKHHDLKSLHMPAVELFRDGKSLEWKENNKELVVNGVYYEVLQVKDSAGIGIVILVEDKNENQLFAKYFNLQEKEPIHFGHQFLAFLNFFFIEDHVDLVPHLLATDFQLKTHPNQAIFVFSISPEELPPAVI